MTDTEQNQPPSTPKRSIVGLVADTRVRAAFVALLIAIGAYFGFAQ